MGTWGEHVSGAHVFFKNTKKGAKDSMDSVKGDDANAAALMSKSRLMSALNSDPEVDQVETRRKTNISLSAPGQRNSQCHGQRHSHRHGQHHSQCHSQYYGQRHSRQCCCANQNRPSTCLNACRYSSLCTCLYTCLRAQLHSCAYISIHGIACLCACLCPGTAMLECTVLVTGTRPSTSLCLGNRNQAQHISVSW